MTNEHFENETDQRLHKLITSALGPDEQTDAEIERLLDEANAAQFADETVERILSRSGVEGVAAFAGEKGAGEKGRESFSDHSTGDQKTGERKKTPDPLTRDVARDGAPKVPAFNGKNRVTRFVESAPTKKANQQLSVADAQGVQAVMPPKMISSNPASDSGSMRFGAVAAVIASVACLFVALFMQPHQPTPGFTKAPGFPSVGGTGPMVTASIMPHPKWFEALQTQATRLVAASVPDRIKVEPVNVGDTIETKRFEKRRLNLPDGSVLYVNENTRVKVASRRRIDVESGEVFVEVVPDFADDLPSEEKRIPNKEQFVVNAGERKLTALGTKFAVSRKVGEDAATNVLVTQGVVDAAGTKAKAGQVVSLHDTENITLSTAPRASHALDWTQELVMAAAAVIVPRSENAGGRMMARPRNQPVTIDTQSQDVQLSLRKYHVDVHIEDGFARTTIDQTYFNQTWQRLEGTFYFPLPPDASLSRLAMYVGDTLMEGGMAERGHARDVYEQIRHTKRDPALLEWVDGSTFKLRIFPLEARQERRVILSYTQRLNSAYGKTTYRFPAGHNMEVVRDWSTKVTIKNGAKNEAKGEAEREWHSPSHRLQSEVKDGNLVLTNRETASTMDRDIVVELKDEWIVDKQSGRKSQARTKLARTTHEDHQYLMIRHRPKLSGQDHSGPTREKSEAVPSQTGTELAGVNPATRGRESDRPIRDWVILFESSGDRDPVLARTQIEVIRTFLDNAEHTDRFAIVSAGAKARTYNEKFLECTQTNIEAAIRVLEETQLIGALDLEAALKCCAVVAESSAANSSPAPATPFAKSHGGDGRSTVLLHVGAGLPVLGATEVNELSALVKPKHTYVGIGIGKRWSQSFMKQAASKTGGYFTQINPDEKVAWRAFEAFSILNAPRLLNVSVADKSGTQRFRTWTDSIADGEEICAITRLPKGQPLPKTIQIKGELRGKPWKLNVKIPQEQTVGIASQSDSTSWLTTKGDYLPRSWAKLEVDRLVAESAATNRQAIIDLSKAMYVMSPFTSLLVLENEEMYKQFAVDRGRKDHWALYPCPEKIKVVYEPGAQQKNKSEPTEAVKLRKLISSMEGLAAGKKLKPQVKDALKKRTQLLKRYESMQSILNRPRPVAYASPMANISAVVMMSDGDGSVVFGRNTSRELPLRRYRYYFNRDFEIEPLDGARPSDEVMSYSEWSSYFNYSVDQAWPLQQRVDRGLGLQLSDGRFESPSASTEWFERLNRRRKFDSFDRNIARYSRHLDFDSDSNGEGVPDNNWVDLGGFPFVDADFEFNLITNGRRSASLGVNRWGANSDFGFGNDFMATGFMPVEFIPHTVHSRQFSTEWYTVQVPTDEQGIGTYTRTVMESQHQMYMVNAPTSEPEIRIVMDDSKSYTVQVPIAGRGVSRYAIPSFEQSEFSDVSQGRHFGDLGTSADFRMRRGNDALLAATFSADQPARSQSNRGVDQLLPLMLSELELEQELGEDHPKVEAIRARISTMEETLAEDSAADRVIRMRSLSGRPIVNRVRELFTDSLIDVPDYSDGTVPLRMRRHIPMSPGRDVFGDLVAYAPGMQVSRMDVLSTADRESDRQQAKLGKIDPGAKKLIDAARAIGWEQVRLPGRSGLTIRIAGDGRFGWDRTLPHGLRENVFCDGKTLWHVYEELGLGSKRINSWYYQTALHGIIPWLVDSAEDFARGADVTLLDERTVVVTPIVSEREKDVKAIRMVLVFDNENRLVERRHELETRVLYRETFDADGNVKFYTVKHDGMVPGAGSKEELVSEITLQRSPCESVDFSKVAAAGAGTGKVAGADAKQGTERTAKGSAAPDGTGSVPAALVIVPMPYRSVAAVKRSRDDAEKPVKEWSEDTALSMLGAYIAESKSADAVKLLRDRFFDQGDTRIGLTVLLATRFPGAMYNGNDVDLRPDVEHSPLAQFMRQYMTWIRSNTNANDFDIEGDKDGFVQRMASARNLYYRWRENRAIKDRTTRQIKSELQQTLAFIAKCDDSLGWMLMEQVHSKVGDAKLNELVADAAKQFENSPQLAWLARATRIRSLFKANRNKKARQEFRDLIFAALKWGALPQIPSDLRGKYRAGGNGPHLWKQLCRDMHEHVIEKKMLRTAVGLAMRLHALGDENVADELLTAALDQLDVADRPDIASIAIAQLNRLKKFDKADELTSPLLELPGAQFNPKLWRFAAGLAEQQGNKKAAVERLERALALEFQFRPDVIDLQKLRVDYGKLMSKYEAIVDASKTLGQAPPADLSARVIAAADRWRMLDDNDTPSCQAAAKILTKLKQREHAWDYLTTPLATLPGDSQTWVAMARHLRSDRDFDRAHAAFAKAYSFEKTNPDILLEHARSLSKNGDNSEANKLFGQIATGDWQPRFNNTKKEAKRVLQIGE